MDLLERTHSPRVTAKVWNIRSLLAPAGPGLRLPSKGPVPTLREEAQQTVQQTAQALLSEACPIHRRKFRRVTFTSNVERWSWRQREESGSAVADGFTSLPFAPGWLQ